MKTLLMNIFSRSGQQTFNLPLFQFGDSFYFLCRYKSEMQDLRLFVESAERKFDSMEQDLNGRLNKVESVLSRSQRAAVAAAPAAVEGGGRDRGK